MLQEPALVPRLFIRMAYKLPKSSHLRRYLTMTTELWGKHIAGPILAVIAIVLVIISAIYAGDPTASVRIVRWSAWLTGLAAACLIFVAQYGAWKDEHEVADKAQSKLDEIDNAKPVLVQPEMEKQHFPLV